MPDISLVDYIDTQPAGMLDQLPEMRQPDAMPTTDTDSVGLNIRAEMGRQRMSMTKLSDRTCIARSTLTEQIDNNRVTVPTLMKIARALQVEAADLLPAAVEAEATSA